MMDINTFPPVEFVSYSIPWSSWCPRIDDAWLLEQIEANRRLGPQSELIAVGLSMLVEEPPKDPESRRAILDAALARKPCKPPQYAWARTLSADQIKDLIVRAYTECDVCTTHLDELVRDPDAPDASAMLERAQRARTRAEALRTILFAAHSNNAIDLELDYLDASAVKVIAQLPSSTCVEPDTLQERVRERFPDAWWVAHLN